MPRDVALDVGSVGLQSPALLGTLGWCRVLALDPSGLLGFRSLLDVHRSAYVQEHPWPSIPSSTRPWGGFGKSAGPSWCHPELPALSISWWRTKGNPISLWLVFSLAGWIQDVFCPVFIPEGN